ncbi:MAG: hypothetical protein JST22_04825 [Bacteroidetes bacterium]|nr:hypothetical protein [Bacteroidota bacterium]
MTGRDGGFSGNVNGCPLWAFGDTFYNSSATDGSGSRSNTAAHADLSNSLAATGPFDSDRAPRPFPAFAPHGQRYSDSTGKPDERQALPDRQHHTGRRTRRFGVLREAGGACRNAELRVCRLRYRAHEPRYHVRRTRTLLLFTTSEPMLALATVAGDTVAGDTVYMYGGKNDGTPYAPAVIARRR